MKVKLKASYDDFDAESVRTGLLCEDVSLAKQSFAAEVDINTIVRRFGLSGELPSDVRAPVYADFEGPFDFHSAMNAIAQAREAFECLPADVRTRFQNDPGQFVDFCSDEANRAEAEKLGLVVPKELGEAPKAPVEPVVPVSVAKVV